MENNPSGNKRIAKKYIVALFSNAVDHFSRALY